MHLYAKKAVICLLLNLFLLSPSIASDADESLNSHENDIFICFSQEHKDIIDSCFKSSFPVRCEELRDNAPWFTGESINAAGKYICTQGVIYGAATLALSYAFGTDISTTLAMAPFIVNKVRLATIIAMEELRTGNRTDRLEVGRRVFTHMVPWKVWAPLGAATQVLSGMSVLDAFSEYPEIPFAGHLCQLFLEAKNINDEHINSDAKNIITAQGTTLFHFKTSTKDSACAVKLHALKHENCILLRFETNVD